MLFRVQKIAQEATEGTESDRPEKRLKAPHCAAWNGLRTRGGAQVYPVAPPFAVEYLGRSTRDAPLPPSGARDAGYSRCGNNPRPPNASWFPGK